MEEECIVGEVKHGIRVSQLRDQQLTPGREPGTGGFVTASVYSFCKKLDIKDHPKSLLTLRVLEV